MRLTAKLVIAFVLVSVILMAVNGRLTMRREVKLRETQKIIWSEQTANLLEQQVLGVWESGGLREVIALLKFQNLRYRDLDIRWVWFDERASLDSAPRATVDDLQSIDAANTPDSVMYRNDRGKGFIYTYHLIPTVVPERQGGLEITASLDDLDGYVRYTLKNTVVLIGIMLLVSGIMVAFLGINVVGRPLQALIDKTRRAGEGDLTGDLELGGNDELTELGYSLNDMCRQVLESQARVHAETSARIATLEQLRHVDRLQTVGRLASGIAHELGTPLNVVSGRAALIASGKLSADIVTESAQTIKNESDRMATIIRQLLDFARRRTPNRVQVNLCEVVHQTKDLMRPLVQKGNAVLRLENCSEPVMADVDVSQLQQVLTNLIVNAIQAMPAGGAITIQIGWRHAEPPDDHDGLAGEYVYIDVQDEGEGIPDDIIEHIFEPFFTSKQVGEGTGLGLSLSYGIIKEHSGWISAASVPGEGSCFSVYLPPEEGRCSDVC